MKNKYISIIMLVFLAACSGSQIRSTVVDRAGHASSAPEWVNDTRASYELNGKLYFVGYVEVEGESSKSAALNMADEKALSEPLRALVDQFIDQNQVGEDLSHSTGQRIISSTRSLRPAMPSLHIANRYWEVIDTGTLGLRAYSLAEIPTAELDKAKQSYFTRLANDTDVQKILKDVGQKQLDRAMSQKGQ
jgi:hypothetical protein